MFAWCYGHDLVLQFTIGYAHGPMPSCDFHVFRENIFITIFYFFALRSAVRLHFFMGSTLLTSLLLFKFFRSSSQIARRYPKKGPTSKNWLLKLQHLLVINILFSSCFPFCKVNSSSLQIL